ncbi:hypothetical protein SUGI_0802390 [Cryptomeria japonica]|nr:hypothetical protein SUGI_0802390 [Cryptomeria japonica]
MDPQELEGLFTVMEAILDEPTWRSTHPFPCTDSPWPGIGCEGSVDNNIWHVTKLHIGMDYTEPCRKDATLSLAILKLQFLKSLFIYNCFHRSNVTIPSQLVRLFPSLEELVFRSNSALVGTIPAELSGLSKLRILSLSQNYLKGFIPPELGNLDKLKHLDFSYNKLSGSIPDNFSGLKSLSILDLSKNILQGSIPPSIGSLVLLEKMDLSYNNLSGRIPSELGKLQSLSFLALSQNRLTGPFPTTFQSLKNLQYLIVEGNPMKCTLPDFWGSLQELSELSLSSSGFYGIVPESLCALTSLSVLALDDNRLSGSIPWCMGELQHLFQLNLSWNLLSGEVNFSEKFTKTLGNKLELRGNKDLCVDKRLYQVFGAGKVRRCSEESLAFDQVHSKGSPGLNLPGEQGNYDRSFSGTSLVQTFQYVVWIGCIYLLHIHVT